MSDNEVRNIIEAALLAAGKCLSLSELALLFEEAKRPAPGERVAVLVCGGNTTAVRFE